MSHTPAVETGPSVLRTIGIYHLILAAISVLVLAYVWVADDGGADTTGWRLLSVPVLALTGAGLMRWQRWAYVLALVAVAGDFVWYVTQAVTRSDDLGDLLANFALMPVGLLPSLPVLILLRRDARGWFLRLPPAASGASRGRHR